MRRVRRFDATPLVVLLALVALGALAGVAWAFLTPSATVTVTGDGVDFPEDQSARLFGGVPVFTLLAVILGVVCALTVWLVLRAVRGVPGLLYAVGLAAFASFVALDVALRVGGLRFPAIDAHTPGSYRVVGDLWLTGAWWGSLAAPWLLLICAPGAAALTYFFVVSGSDDAAMVRPAERAAAAAGTVPEARGAAESRESVTPGPVTGADEVWRTRP